MPYAIRMTVEYEVEPSNGREANDMAALTARHMTGEAGPLSHLIPNPITVIDIHARRKE